MTRPGRRPGPVRRPLLFAPSSLVILAVLTLLMLVVPLVVLTVGEILGLSPLATGVVFLGILVGSLVNVPVAEVEIRRPVAPPIPLPFLPGGVGPALERRTTVVAVNVGGAVLPVLLSAWFLARLPPRGAAAGVAAALVVTWITHRAARPVPGMGIALPSLVPPTASVAATGVAFLLVDVPLGQVAPAAFAAGVLGTLAGADLLNLDRIPDLGARVVSVGGAGTFDGIVLTGVFSTLFAALFFG